MVCYRCAAVCENNDEGLAKWQASELIKRVLSDLNTEQFEVFISGDNNFRYTLYPLYKANRLDKPKPRHLEALRELLVTDYGAEITDGIEADDAIGIRNTTLGQGNGILCSIDKDFLQLPGVHYNFVRREFIEVNEITGWYNFYTQLLVGDAADNIPGCPRIGKVKAPRVLGEARSNHEMYQRVVDAYQKANVSLDDMHRNAKLLYILREDEDQWNPPVDSQKQEPVPQ